MANELYNFIKNISPAELSKLRGKRQDTSTRDKVSFLKKVVEIEGILKSLNIEVSLNKKEE